MSKTVLITGSCGLIGNEAARYFHRLGYRIVGVDNDMRARFFGQQASTSRTRWQLQNNLGDNYVHSDLSIIARNGLDNLFFQHGRDIRLVIHTAAQPSHDWAARNPTLDFEVNAVGTLNVLEAARAHCPDATFIFTSTNKVYGDNPNKLGFVEKRTRFDVSRFSSYCEGINEEMSIDHCTHSVFGASKVAADVMVQEYGRYFSLKTGVFRGGCLTGPAHQGAELHGFLSYLVRCAVSGTPYRVFGYKGKQVRDHIHSHDLITAFHAFYKNPRPGAVYNIGGGRHSHCSVLEAIDLVEQAAGKKLSYEVLEENRIGDHKWYVSDVSKFKSHYPEWDYEYDLPRIIEEMVAASRHEKEAA